jgi:hypothetical protein
MCPLDYMFKNWCLFLSSDRYAPSLICAVVLCKTRTVNLSFSLPPSLA